MSRGGPSIRYYDSYLDQESQDSISDVNYCSYLRCGFTCQRVTSDLMKKDHFTTIFVTHFPFIFYHISIYSSC